MSRIAVPVDIAWEIALTSSPEVLACLLLISHAHLATLRPLLYREIYVGKGANRLIKTLATTAGLPLTVRSLEFGSTEGVRVVDTLWAKVLVAMHNLRHLVIARNIPLSWKTLPNIQFRLQSFTSHGSVIGPWATFVANQPNLQEIACLGDFFASAPGPAHLPVLRRLKARAEDVGKFARLHRLEHAWFWAGPPSAERAPLGPCDLQRFAVSPARLQSVRLSSHQLLTLLHGAAAILAAVSTVVLDEDSTWHVFARESRGILTTSIAQLDHRTPLLESLRLVCALRTHKSKFPPVFVAHAPVFSGALLAVRRAPRLGTFHFCGVDGCGNWDNWGEINQKLTYAERAEHGQGLAAV
ncbi:hypothetical protein FB451DRAFT_1478220 [Mycena latifolia]|nr:hypothetical protein FB451DRAFT_1478220 [Mycena latifolia]